MKKMYLLLFALGFLLGLEAQESAKLTGVVHDEQGKPLAHANVAMLRADSSLVGGVTTDLDGRFALAPVAEVALLRFSYVGYETAYIDRSWLNAPIRLQPKATQLQGVEIKARRPQVRLSGNDLVLNVQGTPLSYQSDVMAVLSQVPGLVARAGGDDVSLLSGGKLLIYLDGREVHSMDEVKTLDIRSIKAVRLDNHPGARYRGDVKAVLHINTGKRLAGLSVLASHESRINHKYSHEEQAQIGYATPKANYNARLSYGDWRRQKTQDLTAHFTAPSSSAQGERSLETALQEELSIKTGRLLTSADFKLSPKLSLGAKYNASKQTWVASVQDRSKAFTGGNLIDEVVSQLSPKDNSVSHHLNAFLSYQPSKAITFALNTDLFIKDLERRQNSTEFSKLNNHINPVQISTDVKSYLWQLSPSLSYQLGKGRVLDLGTEVQSIRGDSHQSYSGREVSRYDNREQLGAGFVSYMQPLGQAWRLKLGLRYEYAESLLDDKLNDAGDIKRRFSNLFYDLALSGMVGKTMHSLSLKSSTTRPSLANLSNNTFRSSQYLLQEGNPKLLPERNYQVGYNLAFSVFYLGLDYTYTKNHISPYLYANPSEPNGYVISVMNYDRAHRLQLMANASKTWGIYSLNATGVYQYNKVEGATLGLKIKVLPMYYLKFVQSLNLPKGYHLNLDYTYQSRLTASIFEAGEKHQLDFYATKSFCSGRLQASLRLSDILGTARQRAFTEVGGLRMAQSEYADVRSVSLKLTYRFNKEKAYRGKDAARAGINRL